MKKIFLLTIFVLIIMLSLSACGNSTQVTPEPAATLPVVIDTSGIIAEGRLEPIRYTDLSLNTNGLVSELLVKEGDEVEAGEVIARLENSEARTLETAQASASQELTAAYQAVRDAQYEMDNFDAPSDFTSLTPTEAVEAMLEKLNTAREAFEPYKNINDRNLEPTNSEKESGVYRNTAKLYKKQLDDAWANYRKAIQWMELDSNLESAQGRLALAQKDYNSLQDTSFAENTAGIRGALANAEIRAPFISTITSLDLKVGEFASAGQPVITVADLSQWVVKTTDLTEIDVVNIKEGQTVEIILDAIPDKVFKGNVFSIGQHYSEKQGDIVYEVTILLTDKDPAMRWGMTAEVKFKQ